MKHKIVFIVTLIILLPALAAVIMLPGCDNLNRIGSGRLSLRPPAALKLWEGVSITENPRLPILSLHSGDIVLDGMGEIIGIRPMPEEDREILAVDWNGGIAGFYVIDLYSREITDLGAVLLQGPQPRLESYAWPWVLLQTEDEDGYHSWALIDVSSGQAQVAWEHSAWVPQGLRRRPVWFNGSGWYLGPVTGPQVTDVLSGKSVTGHNYNPVNPVLNPWPRWGGAVSGSHWYMLPVAAGGSALLDLETNTQVLLEQDQDIAWNMTRDLMAWRQDNKLGLLNVNGLAQPLDLANVFPGAPLWSSNGDNLYFLGGEHDYFGTTWRDLWMFYEDEDQDLEDDEDLESGARKIFTLPGKWNKWRLLAATNEAVLAAVGENSEVLVFFDLMTQKTHELKGVQIDNWIWQGGNLIVIRDGEMTRISPGFGAKILDRDAGEYTLLGIVNQFMFYIHEGRVFIRQLVM